jgi:hypothetical protein
VLTTAAVAERLLLGIALGARAGQCEGKDNTAPAGRLSVRLLLIIGRRWGRT